MKTPSSIDGMELESLIREPWVPFMDLLKVLDELRRERERVNDAILKIEALESEQRRRPGTTKALVLEIDKHRSTNAVLKRGRKNRR